MPFAIPEVRAETASNSAFAPPQPSVTLPSTIEDGDLIVIGLTWYSTNGDSSTTPTGYTKLYGAGSAYQYNYIFVKLADGDASASVSTTLTVSPRWVMTAWAIKNGTHGVTDPSAITISWDASGQAGVGFSGIDQTIPALFAFMHTSASTAGDWTGFSLDTMNASSGGDVYTKIVDDLEFNRTRHAWWYRTDSTPPSTENPDWTDDGTYEGHNTGVYGRSFGMIIPGTALPANNPSSFTYGRMLSSSRNRNYNPRAPRSIP